jgi:hypothetical protein
MYSHSLSPSALPRSLGSSLTLPPSLGSWPFRRYASRAPLTFLEDRGPLLTLHLRIRATLPLPGAHSRVSRRRVGPRLVSMPLNGNSGPNLASERHRPFFLAAGIASSSLHLPSHSPWLFCTRGTRFAGVKALVAVQRRFPFSDIGFGVWSISVYMYLFLPSLAVLYNGPIHFRFPQARWNLCT